MLEEIMAYQFMQRALICGLLVAILCSFMSFFVVLKRLCFAGVGISHSTFGGIAAGLALGANPIVSGAFFALLASWVIGYSSRKGNLAEDSTIGMAFPAAMALGIIVLSLQKSYFGDIFSYLFGNILAVSWNDLIFLSIFTVIVLFFLSIFLKELIFFCFDEEVAAASGLPTAIIYYGLLTAVALTVVVSVKLVGIILASALLVAPAAAACQLTSNYRAMLFLSVFMGLTAVISGLVISYYFDLASGAVIALIATGLFFMMLLAKNIKSLILARAVQQDNS